VTLALLLVVVTVGYALAEVIIRRVAARRDRDCQ